MVKMSYSMYHRRSKACREKSAEAIVVQHSITLHEGQNLTIKKVFKGTKESVVFVLYDGKKQVEPPVTP